VTATPRAQGSNAALRVAVLEDDDLLRESFLLPTLRAYGFDVTGAATAAELYRHMVGQGFDIVLLDLGLPDENGLDVIRHLRANLPALGIVMLTASSGRTEHVRALADGADAFLAKPIDGEVLAVTLHSLARRLSPVRAAPPAGVPRWRLETNGWCLVAPNGALIPMTGAERCVLALLFAAEGQPVERETLVTALAGDDRDFDPRRLDAMVHRLRKKAEAAAETSLPLMAARGVGFLFAA
jgi:DNA-binding response OmpR family regulator